MDNKNRDGVLGPPPIDDNEISFKNINHLDISFKEFMPGQIIQSGQFNDDMNDIEEKVNEICDEHNTVSFKLKEHLTYTNNPHKVTAHQTGTYTSREIDEFVLDVKSGNLYDNAITNRVLDDDSVENRNIVDGSITISKLDNSIGNQLDISQNISITDRYTKEETDAIIKDKVGNGTYSKEDIDLKFQEYQSGQIVDKTISANKVTSDFGDYINISNNPVFKSFYSKSEVDMLIRKNGLPKDWGSITEPVDNDVENIGFLPVADIMTCGQFVTPKTPILDIEVKEVVDARNKYSTLNERLNHNGGSSMVLEFIDDDSLETTSVDYILSTDDMKFDYIYDYEREV